jgi:hypothetical protein
MNLRDFLSFNQHCPVCQEPLTLYCQALGGDLWKSTVDRDRSTYRFNVVGEPAFDGVKKQGTFCLTDNGTSFGLQFDKDGNEDSLLSKDLFFYMMCNPAGLDLKQNFGSKEINPYKACYYRSSTFAKIRIGSDGDKNIWSLEPREAILNKKNGEPTDLTNKMEVFSFVIKTYNTDKVYLLEINYTKNNMTLRTYSGTGDERFDDKFEPKIFTKEFPIPNQRLNFNTTEREALVNKFDQWVLFS